MCRIGDIILVKEYKGGDGTEQRRHPFIVLNDDEGKIECLPFDLTCSVMSSFKSKEQRERKLAHKENVEITVSDGVKKDGYIKADQIFYFSKEAIDFWVLGTVTPEVFTELNQRITELAKEEKIIINTANL